MKKMIWVTSVFAAFAAFGGVLDNAWIQGTTDKNPLGYKPGEPMVFTLAPQDLDGELPAGEFFLDWSRTGDDGVVRAARSRSRRLRSSTRPSWRSPASFASARPSSTRMANGT